MDEPSFPAQSVTQDRLAVLEKGFIEYLNHIRYPGYAASLLRYDPDKFYNIMRAFYQGKPWAEQGF